MTVTRERERETERGELVPLHPTPGMTIRASMNMIEVSYLDHIHHIYCGDDVDI
jgi:hypothetical protein